MRKEQLTPSARLRTCMFADADEMIEQGKFQHRMLHRSNAEWQL
jgi:hypothetical protein